MNIGGIGWSLYSIEGTQKLQGSSLIKPTNSSLEAEATAMLMAAQQLWRLRYEHVAFISDCKQLVDELNQCLAEETIKTARTTEAFSMVKDIKVMVKACNFTFHHVFRSSVSSVNVLAKNARQSGNGYVLTWMF
ncbi:hypothetical protein BRARA_C04396 [Brassica rapa]|uniref:RNase H type-1 domain-containing protein n=1 Tax=Brassica campestris TaxID=3711 RepID=A0A398A3V9_BRACM|nr:hypothetical protein BRARA_C04396 [Brassica rapa]